MTEKLYDIDSFTKEFEAKVVSCEPNNEKFAVVLDKTAFFPEAGGQESDRGTINNVKVTDVQIKSDIILHITDSPLEVGSTVECVIDFDRRFDFMQQHSAEHIVSGVAHRLYGCENVGFHLSEDIVTLDFDKPLSRNEISKVEELANKAVFENKAFILIIPMMKRLKILSFAVKKNLTARLE